MDLRSIINVNEGAESSTPKHAPTPVTPSQAGPPHQVYRDFASHPPPQASPYRQLSQDFGPLQYSSPTTFQGAYHTRPAPPLQLQPPLQSDLRSPAGSSHHSAQSPYRHTPTSSFSAHQYPFPQNPPPQSPVNHQISLQQQLQQRDSYSHATNAPPLTQNHAPYNQSSSVPHTPPVGTPGNSYHSYPAQHQRSQSSHSTSTPTSAQSQHQLYGQHILDSPGSVGHPQHTQAAPLQHHQSQPGTPLGPPISIPRQSSGGAYPLPQSPYSQRAPSTGGFASGYPIIQTLQTSPAPPQISRLSSTPNAFEPHRLSASDLNRRSQSERSLSERERSLSVSPKTRLPSQNRIPIPQDQPAEIERSGGIKREREDSDSSQPVIMNGRQSMESNTVAAATPSPIPQKKRTRYTEPPIWAQSWKKTRGKQASPLINSKRPSPAQTNGKPTSKPPANLIDVPSTLANQPFSRGQSLPPQARPAVPAQIPNGAIGSLGSWEPSILGVQPVEESSKIIADWLFLEVVNRRDVNELASHGIQIEIEAKFGTLLDSDTQLRLQIPTQSECILTPGGQGLAGSRSLRWGFSSSMTENQHKTMNDWLNQKAQEAYTSGPPRVPIQYKHRRERDRFYEIPRNLRKNLPPIIQAHTNPNHAVKVRVTHDEKTGEQLAKIIKTRVADLDIYLPRQAVDCRISINLEMTYDGDIEDLVGASGPTRSPDRNKDRLSYTHSHYQFDLTQVTMADGSQRQTKEHELEIELSTTVLMEHGQRALANPPVPHMYAELVQGLLDNIRVLARNVPKA